MIAEINFKLAELDERLSAGLRRAGTRVGLRRAAITVTHSGDALPFLLFLAVVYLIGTPAWRVRVVTLIMADLLTFLMIQTAKFIVRRARPEGDWGRLYRRLDPYSFPSGHAARGGTMAAMSFIVGPPWFGGILLVWGLCVAASRVLLGVHYVSDAIGGFGVGVVMALALRLLVLAT